MSRTILHIDMNAFFASVEQQANPDLRGKPIAVIGRGRTVVTTASYEARAFGVKTGMNSWQARQKCPHIIFVIGNNRKYTHTSTEIIKVLLEYTPLVEVFSIDEAFMDLTDSLSLHGSAERVAFLLKARIRHLFGLTCSIGIAPNKLLAKLASEMMKPDGLTIIKPEDVATVLERMPAKELCGVGGKSARQLALYGITTCGELGRFPVSILKKRFGVIGERLSLMGRGIDDSPVIPSENAAEVKSVGHSMTLEHDTDKRGEILKFLLQLSEMVGRRARRYGLLGKTVTLSIRYADFDTWEGKQKTLLHPVNRSEDIYRSVVEILDKIVLQQPVRLLGIRVSNLQHESNQLPLFETKLKKNFLTDAMDSVNNRYGDFTVTFGSLLDGKKSSEKGSHVISPAWRPDGIRNVEVK